ncbi:41456_t:CDS:1, partial [Gigaspora margarita]
PLVSIELNELSQVQKNVTPLTQENNVNTNHLLSELVKRHSNIHLPGRLSQMPLESSDIMKLEDFELFFCYIVYTITILFNSRKLTTSQK